MPISLSPIIVRKKRPKPVGLSEVVDFKSILDSFRRTGEIPGGVHVKGGDNFDSPVFGMDNHPGKKMCLLV